MKKIPQAKFESGEFPAPGSVVDIAEGVLWTRMPLPFALTHVNIYLLEDHGGWAVVDTGIGDRQTESLWNELLTGPLAGMRLSRIIATHHHPDHMGLAGWLAERFNAPVYMTEAEFLLALHLTQNARFIDEETYRDLYRRNGMDVADADVVLSQGHSYKRMVAKMPWVFRKLTVGEFLTIGGRRFEILTGGGHSSDQAMLFDRADGLFLCADQVLQKISPNVSVMAIEPEGDPLGRYLRSLAALRAAIPDGVLTLPGHQLPFRALHQRIDELALHHESRCEIIEAACRGEPKTAAEIVPLLFRRPLDAHQMSFAFSETLAHINMLVEDGRLRWATDLPVRRAITT